MAVPANNSFNNHPIFLSASSSSESSSAIFNLGPYQNFIFLQILSNQPKYTTESKKTKPLTVTDLWLWKMRNCETAHSVLGFFYRNTLHTDRKIQFNSNYEKTWGTNLYSDSERQLTPVSFAANVRIVQRDNSDARCGEIELLRSRVKIFVFSPAICEWAQWA